MSQESAGSIEGLLVPIGIFLFLVLLTWTIAQAQNNWKKRER